MSQRFQNRIGGEWRDAAGGVTFENRNPSRLGEVLGLFPDSGEADVDLAVRAGRGAYLRWREIPPPERGRLLIDVGRIIAARREDLARVISRENGKTVRSALGEVQSAVDMALFAGGEGTRWYGKTVPSHLPRRWALTRRYPVGVAGIITSWNFPLAITAWKLFPCLLCGNAAVLKSEENTPEITVHLLRILEKAGLPAGVVNLIHGKGPAVGEAITRHPGIDLVSFTGSSATGRRIGQAGAGRLAKVSLELGGKNAIVVMPDADLDLAVEGIVAGAFSLSGQRCSATSRLLAHRDVFDPLLERLLSRVSRLRIGPGDDPASEVTPLISEKQRTRVTGFLERAGAEGARLACGGQRLAGGPYDQGCYLSPAIVTGAAPESEIVREEIFGPVLVALPAASFEEAVELHNLSPYGLSASIFTRDVNCALAFLDRAETGVAYVNAPTFGSEPHLPFGGVKQSGLGYREAGWSAFEVFSEVKTLYLDYSGGIQNVQFVKP